jgi:CHASE2 domain-containing sensor protein
VNYRALKEHKFFRPAMGAGLAVICGLALWVMPLGENWEDASYDYLYRFGTRSVSNNVVLILMDDAAYSDSELGQSRDKPWDRSLHAKLANKLADGGCPLVVFDVFFDHANESQKDADLAKALGRLNKVVLAVPPVEIEQSGAGAAQLKLPIPEFLEAAKTNWGLGVTYPTPDTDLYKYVRRHWPSPDPDRYPSLPWAAARLAGAHLQKEPTERWLRYYGPRGAWTTVSYPVALNKAPSYYRDKIVFIGNKPRSPSAGDPEEDKFSTPYTRLSDESGAVGGVEIHATTFLNLMNEDWLRRMSPVVEAFILILMGALLGGGLCELRRGRAIGAAIAVALVVSTAGISLSQLTNYWFPWLIIAGGQVPCALACSLIFVKAPAKPAPAPAPGPAGTIVLQFPEERLPDAPEYELFEPPIGQGGFGKVWIVRNAIGQWQALKAVYQSKFGDNTKPYESEFNGLQKYKPVSEKHPGLLRIELVSKMKAEGYFYYVMELGDAQAPGWEQKPASYKPRDLEYLRKQAIDRRLPTVETLRIVTVLAEALDYLHRQGLTHRDIKPSNVIFVNGRPKLADIGLVTDIRLPEQISTLVGTLGYMPPPPEPPGTPQADIFALGMLLYVISTGRDPGFFPDLATTLMERSGYPEFIRLNAIILKACQPEIARRYQTAAEMLRDLQEASKSINPAGPERFN